MSFKNVPLLLATTLLLHLFSCSDDLDTSVDDTIPADIAYSEKCASTAHMAKLMSDPSYRSASEERERAFRKMMKTAPQKANCSSPIVIPVAIHYQGVTNPDRACLTALAYDQIDRLNKDFSGTNGDISRWQIARRYYSGIEHGEMCVRFVIADQNHPNGYSLSDGRPAITINQTQGDRIRTWAGYLNVYVRGNTGVLGYSPVGGSGYGDGVVIDFKAFGAGQGCGVVRPGRASTIGRTLTHEIGHYMYLDHIWGDGCGRDDGVSDTPPQARENYGCPSINHASCGTRDLHMNYMDYTRDVCMYMFTSGQALRMTSYMQSNLRILINNAPKVVSGSSRPDGADDDVDTPQPITRDYAIRITLDNYGSETSWSLHTVEGELVGKIGPYRDGLSGRQYSTIAKLSEGCYVLTIKDSYGDGMCCEYGSGRVDIITRDGTVTQLSDGRFGRQQAIRMCITNQSARVADVKSDKRRKSSEKKK